MTFDRSFTDVGIGLRVPEIDDVDDEGEQPVAAAAP